MTTATSTIFDLLPFEPSAEQGQFLFEVEEFLESDEDFFLLRGSAGTGKTSVAKAVVDFLAERNFPCFLSAPTTRAARIISQKTAREARTMHSRIYRIEPLEDGRIQTRLKENEDRLPTLYIVDEASMISNRVTEDDKFLSAQGLLHNFIRYVKEGHSRSKILFIGDIYQLPPVGYEAGQVPPALSERYLTQEFGLCGRVVELTDVKRQAEGSSILRSATSLRDAMRLGKSWQIESSHFWGVPGAVQTYLRQFDPNRPDAVTYIAPYHKAINNFNKAIRAQLGYTDTLAVGDAVLFHQNFISGEHTIFNGDFGRVVSIDGSPEKFANLHFQAITVAVADSENKPQPVPGLVCLEFLQAEKPELMHEQEKTLYAEVMRTDKAFREAKFKQNHQNRFLGAMRIRHGYGLTAYKAQGSEWDTVLLNTWTPNNQHNLNYLYTGVTRARERLICSA